MSKKKDIWRKVTKETEKICLMTATSHTVKMAACLPQDGDSSDPDKPGPSSNSHFLKQEASGTQGGALSSSATSADIKRRGDKVSSYQDIVFVGGKWYGQSTSRFTRGKLRKISVDARLAEREGHIRDCAPYLQYYGER